MLRLREGEREKRGRGREKGLMRFTKKNQFFSFSFFAPLLPPPPTADARSFKFSSVLKFFARVKTIPPNSFLSTALSAPPPRRRCRTPARNRRRSPTSPSPGPQSPRRRRPLSRWSRSPPEPPKSPPPLPRPTPPLRRARRSASTPSRAAESQWPTSPAGARRPS